MLEAVLLESVFEAKSDENIATGRATASGVMRSRLQMVETTLMLARVSTDRLQTRDLIIRIKHPDSLGCYSAPGMIMATGIGNGSNSA